MESEQKVIPTNITLNNGLEMPRVGLGTYAIKNIAEVVYESIKDGTRMFDTASLYENEKEVGQGVNKAIQEGIVKREDLFIVTKIWPTQKEDVEGALRGQLKELNLDYVDLYLDHLPINHLRRKDGKRLVFPLYEHWKRMENLVKLGLTKSIGVSNFNTQALIDLLSYAEIKPVTNQIEYHPYLYQKNLKDFCHKNGIVVTAYNSMVKGIYSKVKVDAMNEDIIKELALKYQVSPGLILLNWALIQDIIVIPSTANPRRMKENLEALNFKLSQEDFEKINQLNKNLRLNHFYDFDFSEYTDIFA
jgi:D-xylose reductase